MKRILFLDDDKRRRDDFLSYTTNIVCELMLVETAEECIEMLQTGGFDLVSLDHDLGGKTFVDSSRSDTGMEVVRWIALKGGDYKAFIIHSMNDYASEEMQLSLQFHGYSVERAHFGSVEFFNHVSNILNIDRRRKPRRQSRSIGQRLKDYIRSLRMSR